MAARLPQLSVGLAVLEFPSDDLPSIPDGVRRCFQAGAKRLIAQPFFLFSAGHVRDDLPGQLNLAAIDAPGMQIELQAPLGVEPRLLDVLQSRAADATQSLPAEPSGPTALLLVGAGTSDPEANADLYRAARLLWERGLYELVEVAFVSLTRPKIAETVRRIAAIGISRLVVAPYFLNTGVLSQRIARAIERARQDSPKLAIVVGAEMGLHPALLDLLADRARAATARSRVANSS
jgi:sirohydrochlorin cobaltochelatase